MKGEKERSAFFAAQGINEPFPIVSLSSAANRYKDSENVWLIRLSVLLSNFSLVREVWARRRAFDVLYARDHQLLLPIAFAKFALRKRVLFESHFILAKRGSQFAVELVARMADGIVAITQNLQAYYSRFTPRTIVSYCAASEPQRFSSISESVSELRKALDLPQEAIIICYTGNMAYTGTGHSYGIEDIIRSLPLLPEKFVFVGVGRKENERLLPEQIAYDLGVENRALFRGWVTRDEVTRHIVAADILVVPASGAQPGNSPTKMFEYLAAGKLIVAANTEAIAEVLRDGENALMVDYKNPQAWADAFGKIVNDAGLSGKLAEHARADSQFYSWEKRGETIVGFISDTIHE
ncbi:MAG TPA: glycosyltransferase [Candidatus Paceibacterota bacterium]|nr:glycosyltransferase [Candidatus Paceibacterota bacterium]